MGKRQVRDPEPAFGHPGPPDFILRTAVTPYCDLSRDRRGESSWFTCSIPSCGFAIPTDSPHDGVSVVKVHYTVSHRRIDHSR
jgi:hypothetical protein